MFRVTPAFELPVNLRMFSRMEADHLTPEKGNMTSPGSKHGSVLVVDDEEPVRSSLTVHMSDEGYDVMAAATGQEAYALLRSNTFDLIILDWKLPDVSGDEILRFVKDYYPETKVIVITAYANLMIGSTARRDGVDEFLSKPYEVEDLLFTVDRMLSN